MTASLMDDLAALTGEELYNLAGELIANERDCHAALLAPGCQGAVYQSAFALFEDAVAIRADVLAQLVRIPVPMREAAAIIWRARFARGHPVRVPGI